MSSSPHLSSFSIAQVMCCLRADYDAIQESNFKLAVVTTSNALQSYLVTQLAFLLFCGSHLTISYSYKNDLFDISRNHSPNGEETETEEFQTDSDLFTMTGLASERLTMWPHISSLRLEVKNWYFVEQNSEIAQFVWLSYCELPEEEFVAKLTDLTDTGDTLVSLLVGAIAVDGLSSSIEVDVVGLLKTIHGAVCELRMRLSWVKCGLVHEYPDILIPH